MQGAPIMATKLTFSLKLILTFLTLLLSPVSSSAIIFNESFETDGNGTRYFTSAAEFSDGSGDYFTRTDGTNIGANIHFSDRDGYFFAAQDIDNELPFLDSLELQFLNINISNYSNLLFSVAVAEDDDRTNQDWDSDTSVVFEYRIDGGLFTNLLSFQAFGGTNTEPGVDSDFDGVADGAKLTDRFSHFSNAISELGSLLDIKITFNNLNAGDEDIAIDSLLLKGEKLTSGPQQVPTPSTLALFSLATLLLFTRKVSLPV